MTNESNNPELQELGSDLEPVQDSPARTSTLMSPRAKLGVAFVLVAGALVYFAFTAFQGATVSYLSVTQAVADSPTNNFNRRATAGYRPRVQSLLKLFVGSSTTGRDSHLLPSLLKTVLQLRS